VNPVIEFVAKYFIFLSIVIVAIFWLRVDMSRKFKLAWQLILGGAVAELLAVVAGHVYYDTRPFVIEHIKPLISHAADNGFPSDHALLASFLGFTMLFYSRRLGLLLLLIALLIGAARVAAHIHHPIDIVGSFVIAAIAVIVVRVLAHLWQREHPSHPVL
jgi:undecaprenyl-diphosphatase